MVKYGEKQECVIFIQKCVTKRNLNLINSKKLIRLL